MKRFYYILSCLLGLAIFAGVCAVVYPGVVVAADKMQNIVDHLYIDYSAARARVPLTVVNAGTSKFSVSKDGNVAVAGTLGVTGVTTYSTLTGAGSDTLKNSTDDMFDFQGVGGGDNTDLRLDVDGTYPVFYSVTDSAVGCSDTFMADGGMTLACTGCITETNVADTTYGITTPLYAWRTSAGAAPLAIVAGTTPNTATEGSWETFEWATGETTQKIETTIIVPANYVSGMSLVVISALDAAAANAAETFSVSWYTAAAGAADNPTTGDEGAVAFTNQETQTSTTIPLDAAAGGTIAAGQPLRVIFGLTAIDQTVHVFGLGFTYVGK